MNILGITGGMGMGKSTVAEIFRQHHFPIFDADAVVRYLQAPNGKSLPLIAKQFPKAIKADQLDRDYLRKIIAQQPNNLQIIENIMMPLIIQERKFFINLCQARQYSWCVLDIPLLFEKQMNRICDWVVVVSAPVSIQKWRISQRKTISWSQAQSFIQNQMSNRQKCLLADQVIKTGLSKAYTVQQVKRLIHRLRKNEIK